MLKRKKEENKRKEITTIIIKKDKDKERKRERIPELNFGQWYKRKTPLLMRGHRHGDLHY